MSDAKTSDGGDIEKYCKRGNDKNRSECDDENRGRSRNKECGEHI